MIDISSALLSLCPGAQWVVRGNNIEWLDTEQTQPTQEEIVQKIAELEYIEEVEEYKKVRELAYPSSGEQFDKIFHDGVDAWKADIQAIKDAHPKAEIDETILASRQATALFNHQLQEYTHAVTRLSEYQVSVGREEVASTRVIGQEPVLDEDGMATFDDDDAQIMQDITEDYISVTAIQAVDATIEQTTYDDDGVATTDTIENPLITQDNAERAAAQAIVDATPQSVIDQYNS